MRYDLSDELDRLQCKERLRHLLERAAIISLEEVKAKRSLNQNAIFHLWVGVVTAHIGSYDKEQCKEDIKDLLLGQEEYCNQLTGEIRHRPYRTSRMSKEQMADFLTRVQHWAREELGIYLPSEGERGFAEMQERYR